jgi:hypothetical protein
LGVFKRREAGIHGLDVLPEAGPATFSQQRYLLIPELLDPALCSFFWSYAHTKFASRLLRGDDPQVPMTYFRIYKRGDVLHRHRDRPACEISVTINIGQKPTDPWPIYVEGEGEPCAAGLRPCDGLLYRGMELFHWRDAYRGEALVQVFLHYVDRDGPHAEQKFDGRPSLMRIRAGEPRSGKSRRQRVSAANRRPASVHFLHGHAFAMAPLATSLKSAFFRSGRASI